MHIMALYAVAVENAIFSALSALTVTSNHWRTMQRREGVGGFKPPLNLQNILYCVFAKYTLQALLLSSWNPKFYTGKR